MHEIMLDSFDRAILQTLQRDASLTNAELSELVNLSQSQCSRRRTRLEQEGIIQGYSARLDAAQLGYGLRAITRVNLSTHNERTDESFVSFLTRHEEVREAYSVSGDADYVLIIVAKDLSAFADFIHLVLLPHPQVARVQSEIALRTMKSETGLPIG
ncbi:MULTISPECIES: Lrp/AsnC family transcriptional regulator [Brucella]|uniref:Transcriptional regulator, AsnC family n=1 Tax=Ochrobactrum soli TaxID=2448455 RepID=A0A2P9HCQ5_9HYPH|nr:MULTISPECIES: Lrp/AsnC family transcriptional regulator [Brucella]MCI1000507.1 Lrp/AsnC family transcriptional regulator [Ochrobactrum sp. C6C9]MDX4071941.1 Lrp/AsnC family transcriptional regulator [Brucella sp. NBRC 113783]SPL61877.1 Transcriptional regulator, AsnC family [[Ochrobactrum] soli]